MVYCRFIKLVGSCVLLSALGQFSVAAQPITPDTTLGSESSIVTPINPLTDHIEGGATRGINLFHSFQDFGVGQQRTANFINPAGIENIFSRVTGNSRSDILGTLGVLGNANLFLINPNGILFGPDASLDIRGSFTASTANELVFADGSTFSALTPTSPPLLSMDVATPIEVMFEGGIPGDIVNQGDLSVGGDLTLVANNIDLLPGSFVASNRGGNMSLEAQELSMTDANIVSVSTIVPIFPFPRIDAGAVTIDVAGPITLQDGSRIAIIDQAAAASGDIEINAQSLTATNGSQIVTQSFFTSAGDIVINLTGLLQLDGIQDTSDPLSASRSSSTILSLGGFPGLPDGNAGAVEISAGSLALSNGAIISNGTFGQGSAGVIDIKAADSIGLDGFNQLEDGTILNTFIGGPRVEGVGSRADEVQISARTVSITNGAEISSGTVGGGNVGRVTIEATDSVDIDGASPVQASGIGIGTVAAGATDVIRIITQDLNITNGGVVRSDSTGDGRADSVEIVASGDVVIDGIDPFNGQPSSLNLRSVSSADAGNVLIVADQLFVSNEGVVDVSNDGGNGGTLIANTRNVFLDNQGKLTAATQSGQGGEIELTNQGIILLQGDSIVSADSESEAGRSGNIAITTRFIFSPPGDNSDIIARAIRAGNIEVSAQGIFGLEERAELTPFSDITATGIITLNLPNFDPTEGLTVLPTEPRETEVDNTCRVSSNADAVQFYDVGRGGAPPRPDDVAEAGLDFLLEEGLFVRETEPDGASMPAAADGSDESAEDLSPSQWELSGLVPSCAGTH